MSQTRLSAFFIIKLFRSFETDSVLAFCENREIRDARFARAANLTALPTRYNIEPKMEAAHFL